MTVKEFITNYNKTKNIEKHITKKYVPYAQKVSLCDRIVRSTSYEEVAGKQVFKINTPARQELFLLNMIDLYTDIDINWKDSLADFYALSESGLLGGIIKEIPESEITLFSSILDMCVDDLMTNTRDLVSYIDGKIESISLGLNALLDAIDPATVNAILSELNPGVEK